MWHACAVVDELATTVPGGLHRRRVLRVQVHGRVPGVRPGSAHGPELLSSGCGTPRDGRVHLSRSRADPRRLRSTRHIDRAHGSGALGCERAHPPLLVRLLLPLVHVPASRSRALGSHVPLCWLPKGRGEAGAPTDLCLAARLASLRHRRSSRRAVRLHARLRRRRRGGLRRRRPRRYEGSRHHELGPAGPPRARGHGAIRPPVPVRIEAAKDTLSNQAAVREVRPGTDSDKHRGSS